MTNAYIIDGIRTPIGKYAGHLSSIRADDLAALAIEELIKRNPKVEFSQTEDVIFGCANQAGEDNRNVARMALLLAGLPLHIPGETVNRLCASGLSSIVRAAQAVRAGDGDLFITGGVEHMTRAPFVIGKSPRPFGRNTEMYDTSLGWRFVNPKMKERYGVDAMGETGENVAERYQISRQDQDQFAYASQKKAAQARDSGRLAKEIFPLTIPRRKQDPLVFQEDEFIRDDTSLEKLAKLKPAFRAGGTVTAGNASGINDGACALLVGSSATLTRFSLQPLVRIVASAVVGVEPRVMGMGPVPAVRKVLAKSRLSLKQMDVIEINEAFASQSIACLQELGLSPEDERVNPNGGAIALGHPLGMSGARLALTAARELEEKDKRYALCTLCVGVGQGMAVILERGKVE